MPIIATSGPSASVVGIPMGPDLKMDPYFIESQHRTYRNLTVFTGQTAFMECRVRNLGAKQVHVIYQFCILGDYSVGVPCTMTNVQKISNRSYAAHGRICLFAISVWQKCNEGNMVINFVFVFSAIYTHKFLSIKLVSPIKRKYTFFHV